MKPLIIYKLPDDFFYVEKNLKAIAKRIYKLDKVKWLPKKIEVDYSKPKKAIKQIQKYASKYFNAFAYILKTEDGINVKIQKPQKDNIVEWLNENFELFRRILS